MFRSVVGLDVGAHAIKAVVLREAFRAVELTEAVSVEESGAPLAERLRALVEAGPLRGDEVAASLPGHRVSTRILRFPAAAVRKLDQVVPFELENQIPFALDQVVVAHHRLPSAAPASELEVLAAAAQSADVAQLLEGCAAARLDPRTVELETAALAVLAEAVPEPEGPVDGATGIVDFGATKTGVAVVAGGSLRQARTILTGGQAVTRAVAQALAVPEAEAEALKRDLAAAESADGRSAAAMAAVTHALDPLVAEIHKTLAAYRQTGGPEVRRLLLMGGGAALAGLADVLARTLELPARVVRPGDVAGLGNAAITSGPEYTPAVALALGLLVRRHPGRLDFRRGPFAYKRELAGLRRRLALSAGLAAAMLLLLAFDFYADYRARDRRYAQVQAHVQEAYRRVFPQGPLPPNEALALRERTEALKKELAQVGGLAGGRLTPLAVVAELSQRVPRDVRVDVLELVVERNQVRLRAETDSFESVDKIKAELLKYEPFTDIQVSDARVNANQTSVGFRFTIQLAEEV